MEFIFCMEIHNNNNNSITINIENCEQKSSYFSECKILIIRFTYLNIVFSASGLYNYELLRQILAHTNVQQRRAVSTESHNFYNYVRDELFFFHLFLRFSCGIVVATASCLLLAILKHKTPENCNCFNVLILNIVY